jgi:hypothetical protein
MFFIRLWHGFRVFYLSRQIPDTGLAVLSPLSTIKFFNASPSLASSLANQMRPVRLELWSAKFSIPKKVHKKSRAAQVRSGFGIKA